MLETLNINILFTLFLEGLLSFFSPCILPLLPIYFAFILKEKKTNSRLEILKFILPFIIGVSSIFVIYGLGSSFLNTFYSKNTTSFHIIAGLTLILMCLFHFNIIRIKGINIQNTTSNKINELNQQNVHYVIKNFVFGFLISLTWTPCIGPMLTSAMILSSTTSTWLAIAVFCLGFILSFVVAGICIDRIKDFTKNNKNIIKFTHVVSGMIIGIMGIYLLFTGFKTINNSNAEVKAEEIVSINDETEENGDNKEVQNVATSEEISEETANSENNETTKNEDELTIEDVDFSLNDINDSSVILSDYKGKLVIVTFYATWCNYCNEELPILAELAKNDSEIELLVIVSPNNGGETSKENIKNKLEHYLDSFTLLLDENKQVANLFGVTGYPTTIFFEPNEKGTLALYAPGYIQSQYLPKIIEQIKDGSYVDGWKIN